jgi:hypothetical protein
MMHEVKCLSAGQSLAEVFLIGWAFAFMISGAARSCFSSSSNGAIAQPLESWQQ